MTRKDRKALRRVLLAAVREAIRAQYKELSARFGVSVTHARRIVHWEARC